MNQRAAEERALLGKMAQHLLHSGMPEAEACKLLGITQRSLRIAFREAERRRPKRCRVWCTQAPACPYCVEMFMLRQKAQEQLEQGLI